MPFGILEDHHMTRVPGTAYLEDASDVPVEYAGIARSALKHAKGKLSHVILVPQPSDSPNDPLNWPVWKKDLTLVIVGLCAAVVGAFGPMLGPGFVQLSMEFGVSVNKFSQAGAYLILTVGLTLLFTNPIAKTWGRRPVYLVSVCIMFASSVWGANVTTYESLLANRIVSGLGMAPFETLVQTTVADLYFVHQRASRLAVWNLFLLSGVAGGSLISGYIIQDLGWQWTFWICAIVFGMSIFLVFFFVPETSFNRLPLEATLDSNPTSATMSEDDKDDGTPEEKSVGMSFRDWPADSAVEPKKSYLKTLQPFSGRYTNSPFWKIFLRPLVIFWYPGVLWAFALYGVTLTWVVVFSVVNSAIFSLPPYNFTISQVGLISLSPFIFTILGEVISGPLNDAICLYLTKKNHGIYEPEFRLVLVVFVAILGVVGFYGFGATIHYQTHWIGPVLCFGFANMSMAFASGCVFGYVLDSYEELSEEAFVAINLRNFLTFGLTFFVNSWLAKDGALAVFNVLGSVFLAISLTTIPLWIFGKRIRSIIARNDALNKFMKD